DQLEVLFGELPLTGADGSAFDLSTVPLWALERVEVYRSGAPTWLGAGAIGGVLRLVPRESGPAFAGTSGAGSSALMHGRLAAHTSSGNLTWTSAAGVTSSEGDFPYVDDGHTTLDPSDDVVRRRQNGWLREGSGFGHLRLRLAGGTLSALFLGLERL